MEIPKNIRIQRTDSENPDFKSLVKLLDEGLWEVNGEEQAVYHESNQIEHIDTVVVVYDFEQPVACGCYRNYSEQVAEIKRMFVNKSHRGKGLSKLVLKELEKWAFEQSYHTIVLETGTLQVEAINLYKSQGYSRIANYGMYEGLENSLCFEKLLQ